MYTIYTEHTCDEPGIIRLNMDLILTIDVCGTRTCRQNKSSLVTLRPKFYLF